MNQPPVIGFAEIVEALGVSATRAVQLMAREGFPAPIAHLRMGRVWSHEAVAKWCETTGRQIHPIQANDPSS